MKFARLLWLIFENKSCLVFFSEEHFTQSGARKKDFKPLTKSFRPGEAVLVLRLVSKEWSWNKRTKRDVEGH